jgi:hydrogenase-4 membrane subunit HyfE
MIFVMIFVLEMTFTSMSLIIFAILLIVVRWLVIPYFLVTWYIKKLMRENMQILLSILFMDIVDMLSYMMGYHSMDDLFKILCVNAI